MTNQVDRDALSKLVVYPQNAEFVRTDKGEIYPIEEVKKQIQQRVTHHTKTTSGYAVFGFLTQLGLVLLGAVICLHILFTPNPKEKRPGESGMNQLCFGSFGVLLLIFALVLLVDLYTTYFLDRNPEAEFLKRLRSGTLIPARVTAVNPLPNGLTELIYEFDRMVRIEFNGETRDVKKHYTIGSRVLPSKIYEPGDEIVLLYYDDQLLIVL